jgi:hypothetical protein
MRSRRNVLASMVGLALPITLERISSGWTDATTRATALKGKFEIRGVTGHARHTHGGDAAHLGHARFVFINHDDKPHRVSVVDVEFLRGIKSCDIPPSQVASHPKSGGILLQDGNQRESAPQVEVKAGATVEAMVGFTSVEAYYVYCDRFAFRVHFRVDGERIAVIDEINVARVSPLRPQP